MMIQLSCTEKNASFLEVLCQEGKFNCSLIKNVMFQIQRLNLVVNCTKSEVVIVGYSSWIVNVPSNVNF